MKIKYNSESMKKAASQLGFKDYTLNREIWTQKYKNKESKLAKAITNAITNPEAWTKIQHIGDTMQYISYLPKQGIIKGKPVFVAGQVTYDDLTKNHPLHANTNLKDWTQNTLEEIIKKNTGYAFNSHQDLIYNRKISKILKAQIWGATALYISWPVSLMLGEIFPHIAENFTENKYLLLNLAITGVAATIGYVSDKPKTKRIKAKCSTLDNSILINKEVKLYLEQQLSKK